MPESEEGVTQRDHATGIRGVVRTVLGMLDTIVGGTVTIALLALIVIIFAN